MRGRNSAWTAYTTRYQLIMVCTECGFQEHFTRDCPHETIDPILVAHYGRHIVEAAERVLCDG